MRYWTAEWELLLRRYTILGTVVAFNLYISQRLNAQRLPLIYSLKISPMNSKIQRNQKEQSAYEIDGAMFMSLAKMKRTYSDEILFQLDKYEEGLPFDDHVVQVLSGVVIHEEPLFFEIAYVKPSNALTLFLTVKEISCDQYLDYINLKKSLPQAKA